MGSDAKVTIAGALAYDPDMQYRERGGESVPVTNLKIAVNRKYGNTEEVTWFRISVWGNQAESCNTWLKKGSVVKVEGRMMPDPNTGNPRVWLNRQTQEPMASYDVYALNVTFLANLRTRDEQSGVAQQFADEVGGLVRELRNDVPGFDDDFF